MVLKCKYFKEYGLNLEYEYKTYKYVGKDYGDRKSANKGRSLNFLRFIRKKFLNYKEKKYKFCNTYTEWEMHVKDILPELINGIDMYHFLNLQKRNAEVLLESIKTILIPIYIALLQMNESLKLEIEQTILLLFIITIISTCVMSNASKKVNFYSDFMQIVKSNVVDSEETIDYNINVP